MKLLCSSGGKILPRPGDGKLRYVGGETRIISISKSQSWIELVRKTSYICSQPHYIKYQLPGEDLDALISVSSDEDLQNMIEEHYGLENLGASPRLRIFLIPMGEVENLSSFEVTKTSIQQSSPDYHYVAAVNGISDPSPRKIPTDRSSASALPIRFSRNPSFSKRAPPSMMPLEINGGLASFQNMMSPYPSPPISPVTLFADESNTSFMTTPLPTENVGLNTKFHHQLHNQYHNFHLNNELGGPSGSLNFDGCYHERPMQRGRHFHSECPISHLEDLRGVLTGSADSFDPPQGISHAFSDSKLQERGEMSAYHSQEMVCEARHASVKILDDRYQISNLSNETSLAMETPIRYDQNDPFPQQCKMGYREKPPIHFKRQLSNSNIQTPIEGFSTTIDHKPHINTSEHFSNYQMESAPSNVLMMSRLMTASHHNVGSSLLDHGHQQSSNTYFLNGNAVQPLESQRDKCNSEHPHIRSVNSSKCIDDDIVTMVNLCENDLQRASCNNNMRNVHYQEPICLLDDEEDKYHRTQSFGKSSCGEAIDERSDTEDILLGQTRNSTEEHNRSTLVEQNPVVMKDVSTIESASSILVSCAESCQVTIPTSGGFASATLTSFETTFSQAQPIAAKQIKKDFAPPTTMRLDSVVQEFEQFGDTKSSSGEKDGCTSDVAIAEMEANIYGLQIIKNSDLEELRELGSGTYGTVYHGKWRGTDVAIKRIKKSCFAGRSSEQERLAKDFWREAHILSTLHHPNVVAFYGIVPDASGGTLATVTEFMVNGSLRHALLKKERSLDHRKKLMIAMDAAFGMEYLHSKSIVHFDLKCDNLLVNLRDPHRPICKVGDFGLSRIKRNTLVSGGVRGTLPWMAPELLNGSSSRVSEKVDVFSFGVSMWEILTGEEPYADMHCGAIIGGIVKNTLRPAVPEDCDQDWRELMEQCWSLNPDSRPSFTEIANRLRVMSVALLAKASSNQTRPSKGSAS
ncbi:unnamed protein product [Linum trigynum]|uniref:Protein kinase domain-containing protein n=1 Tax=Linum trigynum TaxID=586398 RepID=A0AAV2CYI0_9ROSI